MKNNLLLSFPRSGNTWIRYIAEFISKRPTSHGTIEDCNSSKSKNDAISASVDLGVNLEDRCILIKRHRADEPWDSWTKENCNLICILRDPREAILRHYKSGVDMAKCIGGYVHCLKFYDSFMGNKHIIYYDELLKNHKETIRNFLLALSKFEQTNYLDDNFNSLILNYEFHRKASISNYPQSDTKGDKYRTNYHARMQPSKAKYIMNILQSEEPLFTKYLKRYN